MAGGARRRTGRLDIYWRPNDLGHPRLGVIAPRHGQTAVARNRLRRRLREHLRRRLLPTLPSLDLVVRARFAAYAASPTELTADLDTWHARLFR